MFDNNMPPVNFQNKRKLRIFYQDYNGVDYELKNKIAKNRSPWFSYEICLINFLDSILNHNSNLEIHFTWWYDKPENEEFKVSPTILNLLNQLKSKDVSCNVVFGDYRSSEKSSKFLFNYISELDDKFNQDIIYTCENDYLHNPNWINRIDLLFSSSIQFDYVSLYDHLDNYKLSIHQDFNTYFYCTANNIWRTGFSTCFSKISTLETIKKDIAVLANYPDFICFAYLKLFNRRLLISIPGLSTHGMNGEESPGVNWSEIAAFSSRLISPS